DRGRGQGRRFAAVPAPAVAARFAAALYSTRAGPSLSPDAPRAPAHAVHGDRRRAGAGAPRPRAREAAAPRAPRGSAADPVDRPLLAAEQRDRDQSDEEVADQQHHGADADGDDRAVRDTPQWLRRRAVQAARRVLGDLRVQLATPAP